MNTISAKDIIDILISISGCINRNRERLVELDSQMGDGDLGLYMDLGMKKACEAIMAMQNTTPASVLIKSGMIFATEAPSTMGTLIASGLMAMGQTVENKQFLDIDDLLSIFIVLPDSISSLGGAKRGEKTILDSLIPAAEAMQAAIKNNENLNDAIEAAYMAAKNGVEESRNLRAVHGRPAYFGDATIGKYDGGAVVGMLIFEGLFEWSKNF